MVKLYNESTLPDAIVRRVLSEAQKLSGATGAIVVHVGRASSRGVHGWATPRYLVRKRWTKNRAIESKGGYVDIFPYYGCDGLWSAQSFFKVAIHEFAHVRDYQVDRYRQLAWSHQNRVRVFRQGNYVWRRAAHDSRPEEIRADNVVWEAEQTLKRQKKRRQRIDELIIELGVAIEAARKGENKVADLHCGECLVERFRIQKLDENNKCPKCGMQYERPGVQTGPIADGKAIPEAV